MTVSSIDWGNVGAGKRRKRASPFITVLIKKTFSRSLSIITSVSCIHYFALLVLCKYQKIFFILIEEKIFARIKKFKKYASYAFTVTPPVYCYNLS